jgi:hypothetical protein
MDRYSVKGKIVPFNTQYPSRVYVAYYITDVGECDVLGASYSLSHLDELSIEWMEAHHHSKMGFKYKRIYGLENGTIRRHYENRWNEKLIIKKIGQ